MSYCDQSQYEHFIIGCNYDIIKTLIIGFINACWLEYFRNIQNVQYMYFNNICVPNIYSTIGDYHSLRNYMWHQMCKKHK